MSIDAMRKAYARDEIRELIEAREKAERDELSRMAHATRKGREVERQDVARRMFSQGFTLEQIQMATGASQEQLARWMGPESGGD